MKDGNINDWAMALKEINPQLGKELDEKRDLGFENLEKLNLPRYKRVTMDLESFISSPESAVKNLESKKYYISLIPKEKNLERYSKSDLDINGILDLINQKIKPEQRKKYEIVINEYFENLYGGNIVTGDSGEVLAEFKSGKQGDIAKGKATPEYLVSRDKFTNSFRYSFNDEGLRKTLLNTLLSIPHQGESRELKFTPGYYEFILVKKHDKAPLEPIFIDYRDNKLYNLDWNNVNIDASRYNK